MIWAILKMMLALGVLLTILFLGIRLVKKMDKGRNGLQTRGGITFLTSKLIAPQKYVALVEIGGEILALGISAQNITFLTKIENTEIIKKALSEAGPGPEPLAWLKNFSARGLKFNLPRMGNEK